jgi:DNA-binding MarR family transcriptional regulator
MEKVNSTSVSILRVLYNKFGAQFVSSIDIREITHFLNIGEKYLYKILSILVKNGYLLSSRDAYDRRYKYYKITDLGFSYFINAKIDKKKKRVTTKWGTCEEKGCGRVADLTLYRGLYLCGRCLAKDNDLVDLNLEDYVYANSGPQW